MRFTFLRLLLEIAATETSGGGGGTGTTETPPPKAATPPATTTETYESRLAKHGNDAATMAREVYRDHEKLRQDLAVAQSKVPADGTVVLSKADAARWAEYNKLGTHDEVKTKLTAGSEALGRVATFEREKLVTTAAKIVGYDPEVLAELASKDRIEIREETKGGKTSQVAEVVTTSKNDKGEDVETRTELAKHAAAKWPKFLGSLKLAASPAPRVGGSPTRAMPPRPAPGHAGGDTQGRQPTVRRSSF